MTAIARLMALLGQVEARHWAAMGASALLHLAVVLGFHQAPPPPTETVSFEIALQPPEEARLKTPQARPAQAEKSKQKKLAKVRKAKPKAVAREAHTLEAELKAEKRSPRDVPVVALPALETPRTESRVAEASQASDKALPQPPQEQRAHLPGMPVLASAAAPAATAQPPSPSTAASAASETPQPAASGTAAGGSDAPSGEAGLALAAAHTMALAPGGGDMAQGAATGASPGSVAEDANPGFGPATFSASGGVGGGVNLAVGAGANANAATPSGPVAAGEPQGLRLTASGTLSNLPEFPQGKGSLATGHLAPEAGAASVQDRAGRGQSLASVTAGGESVSPMQGPAASPGKGGQGVAIEGLAGARRAAGSGPAPGRLAGAVVPGRGLSGGADGKPGGNSSQHGKALALAPGEPGSGPQWAVLMVPVQTGAPMPWLQGRGGPGKQGGQASTRTATAPGGGDSTSAAAGPGNASLARAGTGKLSSVAPKGMADAGRGHDGGQGMAPAVGAVTPGGASAAGAGRGMASVLPAEQKIVRQDSRVEPLDVLAPSNYCPLPIHAQPDNRPPTALAVREDRLELPRYAETNPSFVYPVMANVYGVEGKLIMRVQVQADGRPGRMLLKQSSGNGILDQDAREQLARWRFHPARKNGQAVASWVDVPVTYRLPEGRK